MSALTSNQKQVKTILNGIENPGNFCYIISALQALRFILKQFFIYHDEIIQEFIKLNSKINLFTSKAELMLSIDILKLKGEIDEDGIILKKLKDHHLKVCVMLLLRDIIISLDDETYKSKYIKSRNFLKVFNACVIENGIEYICNGEQNDSNEFIIILLDYLNDCVFTGENCILNDKSILELTSDNLNKMPLNSRVKIQMQQYYYNTYIKEYSYFHKTLNTLILNVIKCINCNFKQTSVNASNNICCSIPTVNQSSSSIETHTKLSIYDCLNNYFKEEKIEYKCDNCCETNENIMVKKILDNKKYLIITMKKFEYNPELGIITKKHDKVSFPFILDIKNYSFSKTSKYYLRSVVNHVGMLNYGHYYTDAHYNNKWFRCNDENINEIPLQNINNNDAYILIYEKN